MDEKSGIRASLNEGEAPTASMLASEELEKQRQLVEGLEAACQQKAKTIAELEQKKAELEARLLLHTGPECPNKECEDHDGNHPYHDNVVERFWRAVNDSYEGRTKPGGEFSTIVGAKKWGEDFRDAVARLQLVAETPDLKRARKRIHEKTTEVAAVKQDIERVMRQSNVAVKNVLDTVRELCRLGSMTERSGPDEDRLRGLSGSLMKIPLPYILNGQVKPGPATPEGASATTPDGQAMPMQAVRMVEQPPPPHGKPVEMKKPSLG